MGPRFTRTAAPPAQRKPSASASARSSLRERPTTGPLTRPSRPILSDVMARREPGERDMRRKRPPALSFLLRMSTARRLARVVSLLALDFAGVSLAIFTSLVL